MLHSLVLASQVVFPAGPGPVDNPLKGFAAYTDEGRPFSCPVSMAFEEVAWNVIEPEEGRYDFDRWEKEEWAGALAKGKPVVIRIYADYPAKKRAVPQWLLDKGVKTTAYDEFGGGVSPDYENPTMVSALLRLIAAMGARYDKDPRVAFVQLGLLGHWGEWHTYPHDALFASPKVQSQVVQAFHKAFPHKLLMARNAAYSSCQVPWLGFHDDMIPEDTLGPDRWDFVSAMTGGKVDDNWKVAPTGGEMVPGATHKYLGTDWPTLVKAVQTAHFTWIGPYSPPLERSLSPQESERAAEIIRIMGYQFRLTQASIPSSVSSQSGAKIQVNGINEGVAPFYYSWPIKAALIDSNNRIANSWQLSEDVRQWLPGSFETSIDLPTGIKQGTYRLAIGIFNPNDSSVSIKFANALPMIDGYTVLGQIDIQ